MRALLPVVLLSLLPLAAEAQGFRFSNPDPNVEADKAAKAARRERIDAQLSTPCRAQIKNRKIVVLIGEEVNGVIQARQANFGGHVDAVNERLRALGLRTYSPEEIRRQIAQAEVDAVMRNDPDAALSAAKRLAANYTLKGVISARAMHNPMIRVNQVAVSMRFVLTGSDGRPVAQADAQSQSFSGADVQGMALKLINEQAEEVVARLYSDYCQQPDPRRK